MTDEACDHLRVRITRVIRPYDDTRKSRFIGGHCEDCGFEVAREMSKAEIDNGKPETRWLIDLFGVARQ